MVPRCLQEQQTGMSAMFLSLPVKAQLGGVPALFERCLGVVHALGWGGGGGVLLTGVNLNEAHMQPDFYSNLSGFQPE